MSAQAGLDQGNSLGGQSTQTPAVTPLGGTTTANTAKGYKSNPNLGPSAFAPKTEMTAESVGLGGDISRQPGYNTAMGLNEIIQRERQALKPGNTSALLSQLSPFEMSVFGADRNKDYFQYDPRLFDATASPEKRAQNALEIYNMRNKANPWQGF